MNNDNNVINGAFPNNSTSKQTNGGVCDNCCGTNSTLGNIYSNVLNMNNIGSILEMYQNLNQLASSMIGLTVKWFRALPVKEQQDVLFMTYTLSNVEECPLNINVVLPDGTYNDSQYTYDMMGLEYEVPLEVQIDKSVWATAAGPETMPQRGDIVYIPISNKLYEVVSSTILRGFMEQETGYRVNLTKYKPTVSRREGEALKETIDNYTVSVEELFGKQIDDTIENLVDDKQTSPYNTTSEDKYKKISRSINIINKTVEMKGHIVIKSYYDLKSNYDVAVKYININDVIPKTEHRYFNSWINIPTDKSNEVLLDSIVEDSKDNINTYFILKYKGNIVLNVNDYITISRGNIILSAKIVSLDNGIKIAIDNICLFKIKTMLENWSTLGGYKIKKDSPVNLLSGTFKDYDIISITLYSRKYLEIKYLDQRYLIIFNNQLENNTWNNISVNIGDISNVKVYAYKDDIVKVFENDFVISLNNMVVDSYYIKPSNSYMSNIRLYNIGCYDDNIIEEDIISYFTKNAANGIILDNANIEFNAEYFGEQK